MIYPTLLLKHLRTKRAIANYPLYDVPHKRSEDTLDKKSAQENFDYFMNVRRQRLVFFQRWLHDWFRVVATLDGDGLVAVNRWINGYGGGLIGDQHDTMTIFATYQPAWAGEYAGYNVVVDIGIFVGEYLIARRPHLRWEIFDCDPNSYGDLDEDVATDPRPVLVGFPRRWTDDVLKLGYWEVATARQRSHIADGRVGNRDGLIKRCKQSLHLANVPDNDQPYIFGDYSSEPI